MLKFVGQIAAVALGMTLLAWHADAQSTKLRSLGTQNDALAWQGVGRLNMAGKGFCTGTLIAPDMVLTAAHCVYDDNDLFAVDELTFIAGLTNGEFAAKRGVSQIEAHVGYDPARGVSNENVRHDIALLRLSKPIATSQIDPFVVYAGEMPKGPVSVVSYGRGRSNALSRQNACEVLGTQRDLIVMDCDVTFGSSGAPVFTHRNGRGQIASVMSGIGTRGGKKIAFGMSLPPLISDLKRQMYANKASPGAQRRRVTVGGQKSSSGAKFVTAKGS